MDVAAHSRGLKETEAMELQLYLRMVLRSWWIVALTTLTALSISLTLSYFATPLYRTSAQLLVSPSASLSGSQAVYGLDTLNKRSIVSTYAEVLSSSRIYSETGALLGLSPTEVEAYTLATVVLPEANVLELSVTGPDPEIAALLANGVGQRAVDYIKGLYQAYEVNFLELAPIPTIPVSPGPVQDASLAAGLGLILGVALAVARAYLPVAAAALQGERAVDGAPTDNDHLTLLARPGAGGALPAPRPVKQMPATGAGHSFSPPVYALEVTQPHPVMTSAVFEVPLPAVEPGQPREESRQAHSLAISLVDWYRRVRLDSAVGHRSTLPSGGE